MGIDGIGKPPPIGPTNAPVGPSATGGKFDVGATTTVQPSGDLSRLERGEIGLDAYLDNRVEEATRHLASRLSPEQLTFVRQTLRSELTKDPVLVELVQRATGKIPETTNE